MKMSIAINFLMRLIFKLFKKLRLVAVRNSTVHPTAKLESGTTFYNSNIDRHSFCGYDCDVYYADIGGFTSIANGVILGGGHHPMEWVGMSPVFYEGRDSVKAKFATHKRDPVKRISIGHDVWIGRSVVVLSGINIGNGAVIGAGSIVTKSVPPYAIVGGNPAKILRYRFDPSTISRLEASEWWFLPEERLYELGDYFNNPEKFLDFIETREVSL